jgi:hypothetical protein
LTWRRKPFIWRRKTFDLAAQTLIYLAAQTFENFDLAVQTLHLAAQTFENFRPGGANLRKLLTWRRKPFIWRRKPALSAVSV